MIGPHLPVSLWAFPAALSLMLAWPAQAADPVRGAALFATAPAASLLACADCHSDNPAVNNFGNIFVGRNAVALIQRAIGTNTGGMGYFSNYYAAADLADIAAWLGNAPARLDFGATAVGRSSAALEVAVRASSKVGIGGLALQVAGDFVIQGSTCGTELARGESCSVDVAFRPSTAGARAGALSIVHDATPTPVRIVLAGMGLDRPPAVARVLPALIAFAPVAVGQAGTQRTVTLFNDSANALTVGSAQTSRPDFVLAGGTCVAGAELAAAQSCTLALRLDPSFPGARAGTLRIEHDGQGGGSTVALAGDALAGPAAALDVDAPALAFGSWPVGRRSSVQWVTLSNTGNAALQWREIAVSDAAFMVDRSACPQAAGLAPGSSCRVAVSFEAQRSTLVSAELLLAHQASALRVPLSGSGQPAQAKARVSPATTGAALPQVETDAARVVFRDRQRGSSDASDIRRVTLTNRSPGPLDAGVMQFVGDHGADFSAAPTCAAGALLQPNEACSIELRFAPRASGLRQATLLWAGAVISLQGRAFEDSVAPPEGTPGTATAGALAWQSVPAHPSTAVGGTPSGIDLTLFNRGQAPAAALRWALSGAALQDFSIDAAGSSCRSGADLAPGAACVARVLFHPGAPGLRRARLAALADGAAAEAELQGTGLARPIGIASVQPEAIAFVAAPELRSGRQSAVVGNAGSAVLRIVSIGIQSAAFGLAAPAARACPAEAFDLMPGDHCSVDVTWSGSAESSLGGTLLVTTDSGGSIAVPLSATEDPNLRTNEGTGGGGSGLVLLLLLACACLELTSTSAKHD